VSDASDTNEPTDPLDREAILVLVGPTASGKTELSLRVAEELNAEIVSLDSMLVYRGMDIGTAKPSLDERARVAHHMIDIVTTNERYDAQRYLADARRVVGELQERGKRALFVGGTAFYLAALLRGMFEGPPLDVELRKQLEAEFAERGAAAMHEELASIDPESAARLHQNDHRRVTRALEVWRQTGRKLTDWQQEWGGSPRPREQRARMVGLALPTEKGDARIRKRTRLMFDAGWREEALAIRAGLGFGPSAVQALGYREVLAWADGLVERDEAEGSVALKTRQFARRQRTWYRKFAIEWLDAGGGVDVGDLGAAACGVYLRGG
jgi:tRNA dimethylallyltransferase